MLEVPDEVRTMNRFLIVSLLVVAPGLASAQDAGSPDADEQVRAALEDRAEAPPTPPELPTTASDQARKAHAEIAFGQRGEAMREAHREAKQRGEDRAKLAREEAAQHEHAAAASANAENHRAASEGAASRARANEARGRGPRTIVTPSPRR